MLNPQAAEFTPGAKGCPINRDSSNWNMNVNMNMHGGSAKGFPISSNNQQWNGRGAWAAAAEMNCEDPRYNKKLNPNAQPYGAVNGVVMPNHKASSYNNHGVQNTTIAGHVVGHKVFVSTPWYTKGVDKAAVQLSTEIQAFHTFMRLTQSELSVREGALCSVRSIAMQRYPAMSFLPYGSFAVGSAVSTSALDVMIDNCGVLNEDYVKDTFSSAGIIKSLMCNDNSTGFVQVETPSGVVVNISLHSKVESQPAMSAVQMCRTFFDRCPHALPVLSVLRQVMAQTGNLEVSSGGLSAYALSTMLISLVSNNPMCASTPGAMLLHFCKYYGRDFPFADYSVCPKNGLMPKRHPQDAISIIDPFDPEGNLAAGCTRTFQIQVQLQHCHLALLRWEGAGDRKGYKGRTPLSGVICHQKLWSRSDLIQKEAEMKEVQNNINNNNHNKNHHNKKIPSAPSPEPSLKNELCIEELRKTFTPVTASSVGTSQSPAASLSSHSPDDKPDETELLFSPFESPKNTDDCDEPLVNMSFASGELLDLNLMGLHLDLDVSGSNTCSFDKDDDTNGQSLLELCLASIDANAEEEQNEQQQQQEEKENPVRSKQHTSVVSGPTCLTPGLSDSPVSCPLFENTRSPDHEQPPSISDASLDLLMELDESDFLFKTIDAAVANM